MDVGSFPKRRERVGMPMLSVQGRIHSVSRNTLRNPCVTHKQILNPAISQSPSPIAHATPEATQNT